jgi:hypothetical protein
MSLIRRGPSLPSMLTQLSNTASLGLWHEAGHFRNFRPGRILGTASGGFRRAIKKNGSWFLVFEPLAAACANSGQYEAPCGSGHPHAE